MLSISINKKDNFLSAQVPLHTHGNYEIYFLNKGKTTYLLDEDSFSVSAGSVVVVPPHCPHQTSSDCFERTIINVAPTALNDFQVRVLNSIYSLKLHRLSAFTISILENCFSQMLACKDENEDYEFKMHSIFAYIIFLLDWDFKTQSPIPVTQRKMPVFILRMVEYVEENFTEDLSLASLAKHFNFSVSYIKKAFKKYLGKPVHSYMLELRIDKAKHLLLYTHYSLEKIAEQCGFPSSNYLSLIFKKKVGISPRAYKKLKRL